MNLYIKDKEMKTLMDQHVSQGINKEKESTPDIYEAIQYSLRELLNDLRMEQLETM